MTLKQNVELAWGKSEMTSHDRLKANAIHCNTFPEILPLELFHRILHMKGIHNIILSNKEGIC